MAGKTNQSTRDEMLRLTLQAERSTPCIVVLSAEREYLDAVKAYLDIDVFADAMLRDIRFKVPYIGELICDTDCPAVEDYNDFAEKLEGYMDVERYGADCMEHDGVVETEFGRLRRLEPPFLQAQNIRSDMEMGGMA